MARSNYLPPLFVRADGNGVGLRQGVVVTWDGVTQEHTINVAGATFENLPILTTVTGLSPGAVVAILTAGSSASSWLVLGEITVPGS